MVKVKYDLNSDKIRGIAGIRIGGKARYFFVKDFDDFETKIKKLSRHYDRKDRNAWLRSKELVQLHETYGEPISKEEAQRYYKDTKPQFEKNMVSDFDIKGSGPANFSFVVAGLSEESLNESYKNDSCLLKDLGLKA